MRGLFAVAVMALVGTTAQAQWTTTAVPLPPVTGNTFQDNMWVFRGYPNGYLCGFSYTKNAFGVQTPDKQWVQPPVDGQVTCVSADGRWVGGYSRSGTGATFDLRGWRWKVGTTADKVERIDTAASNYSWAYPIAIGSDGAAVTKGAQSDGWQYGGTWAAGQTKVVTVPCQYGYIAPGWAFQDAYTIEPGPGGYVVTGAGQEGANPYTGFRTTGPLPGTVAVAGRPKPKPKPPAGSLAALVGDIPPAVLAQMLRGLLGDQPPPPAPPRKK